MDIQNTVHVNSAFTYAQKKRRYLIAMNLSHLSIC